MTLTLDASTPSQVTKTATGTTLTCASFTAPTNGFIVAFVAYDTLTATVNNHTVTDSGGLTWTLRGRKSPTPTSTGGTGTSSGVEIWTATTASSAARTVTATQGTAKDASMAVKVFTDTSGAPTAGAITGTFSASGLPSGSVTTTAANSWVWAVISDWSQQGSGTFPAGQTRTDFYDAPGLITTRVAKVDAITSTSGTAVTVNMTAPSAQQYNQLTFEIKANGTVSAAPARPPQAITRVAGIRAATF